MLSRFITFWYYDVPYLTSKFAPFCPLMEWYDWPNYAKAKKRKRKLQSWSKFVDYPPALSCSIIAIDYAGSCQKCKYTKANVNHKYLIFFKFLFRANLSFMNKFLHNSFRNCINAFGKAVLVWLKITIREQWVRSGSYQQEKAV